jgi:transposase-like protein
LSGIASEPTGAVVIHVPPSRVANYFDLPRGDHRAKKGAADDAVNKLLSEDPPRVELSDRAQKNIAGLARTHDFSDALLQFVWYAEVGCRELAPIPGGHSSVIARATDPKYKRQEQARIRKKREQKKSAERKLKKKKRRRKPLDEYLKIPATKRKKMQ